MLRELHRLADQRESFAFETTLASRTFAPWIRQLRNTGYRFVLGYIWVESPDISVERVAARVRSGGHHVEEEVVRRRWSRSVWNFWNLYFELADDWRVYDNSLGRTSRIAFGIPETEPTIVRPGRWAAFLKTKHDPESRRQ